MIKVRINREYSTLVAYCESARGAEWVCIMPEFEKHNAKVWEIWQYIPTWRKRQTWRYVGRFYSFESVRSYWEYCTGQIIPS